MQRKEVGWNLERRFDEALGRRLNVDALRHPSLHTRDFRHPDQPGPQSLMDLHDKGLALAGRGTLPDHTLQCRPILIVSLTN